MFPIAHALKKVNKDPPLRDLEGDIMRNEAVCDVCGGSLIQSTTSLQLWHDKHLVIVSDVPAEMCRQCGQSHVAKNVSARIEQFLQSCNHCQPQRYIQVPEFSAAQILHADS